MSDALLALLQKVLGHDLPNQLVAIQGLARLLEMDQAERLDDEGKDHLRRLAAAAQRTHERVRELAGLVRAERSAPSGEMVSPEGLTAAKALLPGPAVEYHGPEPREP